MSHSYIIFIIALLTAAIVEVILAARTWRFRRTASGFAFLGLVLSTFLYAFGYAFELTCATLPEILVWNKVQYLGIAFIPAFWVILAARYSGRDAWLSRPVAFLLFGISALTVLFDWTNAAHHLYYRTVGVDLSGRYAAFYFEKGPWYWVHIGYTNLALLVGNSLLLGMIRHAKRAYRRQALVMLIGSLIPWLGLILYLSGQIPHHLDTTPLALTLSAPLFAWGLFRYRIFDIAPVAKESVFSSMKDGAVVLDIFDRIVDYNPAAKQVLPFLSRRAIGRTLRDVAPDRRELHALPSPEETTTLDLELEANGRNRFFRANLSPIYNRRRSLMGRVVFLIETTPQVELMNRLKELATVDDLTGAVLRRHFLELFRKEITRARRYGRPVSVLIIDLDHFKQVNDTFGHESGDAVLKASADVLRKALRSADLLCRHGGEEFAVLLPETPLDQAVIVAERLRKTIHDNPIQRPDGIEVRITASIGVAGLGELGNENPEDLLRAADAAMYVAKAAGRNAVHVAAPAE